MLQAWGTECKVPRAEINGRILPRLAPSNVGAKRQCQGGFDF